MKLTKEQLRNIIKEEVSSLTEGKMKYKIILTTTLPNGNTKDWDVAVFTSEGDALIAINALQKAARNQTNYKYWLKK